MKKTIVFKDRLIKDKIFILLLGLVIGWMGLIFFFSSQLGEQSSALSSAFVNNIINVYTDILKSEPPQIIVQFFTQSLFIRKMGHFTIFFVLGVLTVLLLLRGKLRNVFITAFIICFIYAVSDELHQLFVPGRDANIIDVLIDSAGSVSGILLINRVRGR